MCFKVSNIQLITMSHEHTYHMLAWEVCNMQLKENVPLWSYFLGIVNAKLHLALQCIMIPTHYYYPLPE